jgi:hypothetical protein
LANGWIQSSIDSKLIQPPSTQEQADPHQAHCKTTHWLPPRSTSYEILYNTLNDHQVHTRPESASTWASALATQTSNTYSEVTDSWKQDTPIQLFQHGSDPHVQFCGNTGVAFQPCRSPCKAFTATILTFEKNKYQESSADVDC